MKKSCVFIMFLVLGLSIMAENYKYPPSVEGFLAIFDSHDPRNDVDDFTIDESTMGFDDAYSFPPATAIPPVNIIVNKRSTRLYLVNVFGDTLAQYPICASSNRGQKKKKDDCRTPEGTFTIDGIYNSKDWRYKKTGPKAYGPFYISLRTPGFWGIGIHGTNAPGSIPGRHSHGCIRMHNEDIVKVKSMVNKNSTVTILPDDPKAEAEEIARIRREYVPSTRH